MKKSKIMRLVSLMLMASMLISVIPLSASATNVATFNAARDVLPGGEGIGFTDNPDGGGSVRGLETLSSAVCLRKEEWIKYDLSGLDDGTYILYVTHSNTSAAPISLTFGEQVVFQKSSLKVTGSYSAYVQSEIGIVTLTSSNKLLTVENVGSSATYLKEIKLVNADYVIKRRAFEQKVRPYSLSFLPCIIEAEDFDAGADGVSYHDTDSNNIGGAYREETGVDIFEEEGRIYTNLISGDWVRYTVSADNEGNYDLILNSVDPMESSIIRVFMDGYEIIRTVPREKMSIGEFKETVLGTFHIKKGVHTVLIKCMDGDVNIDYLRFKKSKSKGIDISDKTTLRSWKDAQELTDEDYNISVEQDNPVEREIYVVSGAKGGNGTQERPFGTIEEARDFVKTINKKMSGDIVVNLSGVFRLDKTVEFRPEDSGSNGFNVIYRGDSDTVIHGGKKITGWKQAEGSPLYQVSLPDVSDFRQLYIGDNRGVRSKSKWLYWMKEAYDNPETNYDNPEGYIMDGNDFPDDFKKPKGMEIIWMPSWKNVRIPVENITKTDSGDYLVTCIQPYFDLMHTASAGVSLEIPYYIENAPEFLDEPGEYYFDKDTKVLTYYPFEYEDLNALECYIPVVEQLVDISGVDYNDKVRNITFENVKFKYGAWDRTNKYGISTQQAETLVLPTSPDEADAKSKDIYETNLILSQVKVMYGENINFYDNEFSHMGSVALSMDGGTAYSNITGNLFDDNSASAITIGNSLTAKDAPLEMYPRKINITNNVLRRQSVEYMTPAVTCYYVNNVRVDHNDILDTPYSGISMGWGWAKNLQYAHYNKVTNNRIENVLYKLKDGGHIYTLSENKGGIISGNYMIKAGDWKGGIYHDNGSAQMISTNNVFEECAKWIKITWSNVINNTAYNNYSERTYTNKYPDNNPIEKEIGKTDGQWPKEAQEIIANAGVTEEYKYILEDYANRSALRNDSLKRQPYMNKPGIFVEAGDVMEGGSGVAYYDISNSSAEGNMPGEPGYYHMSDGTNLKYIMVTGEGEWTKYKVNVTEAGNYQIIPNLTVVKDTTAISVEVDGKVVVDKFKLTPNCTAYNVFDDYNVGSVYLEPGEHIIKIEHAVENFGFKYFRLAKESGTSQRNDGFNKAFMDVILGKN